MNFDNAIKNALFEIFEDFNTHTERHYGKEDLLKAIQKLDDEGFFENPEGTFKVYAKISAVDGSGTLNSGWVDENSDFVDSKEDAKEFETLEDAMDELNELKEYLSENADEYGECRVIIRVASSNQDKTAHRITFFI